MESPYKLKGEKSPGKSPGGKKSNKGEKTPEKGRSEKELAQFYGKWYLNPS